MTAEHAATSANGIAFLVRRPDCNALPLRKPGIFVSTGVGVYVKAGVYVKVTSHGTFSTIYLMKMLFYIHIIWILGIYTMS